MIKAMKKSLVLAAAVAAMSAIAVPSMASAANWAPVGGPTHTLTGGSIYLTVGSPPGSLVINCNTGPTLGAYVTSTSVLTITSASNFSCTGASTLSGCNIAAAPTGLPWTANGPTTSNVTINSVNITLTFTSAPGKSCVMGGVKTLSGTLTGGVWSAPGGPFTPSSVGYTNATGLTFTSGGTSLPTSLTSSQFFRDNALPYLTLS